MQSTGLAVPLDARVSDLPVGNRQRLEILKALYRGAKILILDEPTAVLTPQETEQLFDVLARLARQGTTILLITHKLKEVMRLCDRVTVMRAGRVVHETAVAQTSVEDLALAMVGRKVQVGRGGREAPAARAPGPVLLRAEGIVLCDALRITRLHGLDIPNCTPVKSSALPACRATAKANSSTCWPAPERAQRGPLDARWRKLPRRVPGSTRVPHAG